MKLKRVLIGSSLWLLVLAATLELSDQEAYYWTWAKMPALCYFEHPPMQAWITALLTFVLGNSAWVVRLPALLGRLAIFFIFWRWAKERFGTVVAEIGLWILVPSFFMIGGGLLSLPDVVMLPFALLTLLYCERRQARTAGFFLGLAGLSKWTAAVLIPGYLYSQIRRDPLTQKRNTFKAAQGALIAFVLQAPVFIWNAQHGWASFLFHLRDRHSHPFAGFSHLLENSARFVGSQFLLGGLGFIVALGFALPFLLRGKKLIEVPGLRTPLWIWIWPAFLIFGISAASGELRFYWTSFAFFPLAAALGQYLICTSEQTLERFKKSEGLGLIFTLAFLTFILYFPVGFYAKPITDLYKRYDLRHSPRGDLKGWLEFSDDLHARGLLKNDIAYLGSNFRIAAQLAWAMRAKNLRQIGTVDYKQFQFEFWPRPSPQKFSGALFFADNRYAVAPAFQSFCADPVVWQQKEILLRGHVVKEIQWSLCEHFVLPEWAQKTWSFSNDLGYKNL